MRDLPCFGRKRQTLVLVTKIMVMGRLPKLVWPG